LKKFIASRQRFGYFRPGSTGHNLQLAECVVEFLGVSGLNMVRICNSSELFDEIRSFHPDLIILQIGGNDLCKRNYSAMEVAHDITSLASELQFECNCSVLISQLIPRVSCPTDYNDKVQWCNQYLSDLNTNNSSIALWKHRGIWNPNEWIYGTDGVHFNDLGKFKLFNSYRAAAVFAMRRRH
jgi:lysophospholipase L1-like esterase